MKVTRYKIAYWPYMISIWNNYKSYNYQQ